jgi:hypothetical protein
MVRCPLIACAALAADLSVLNGAWGKKTTTGSHGRRDSLMTT